MIDIKIDLSRDVLFDELGIKRLRESYMKEEEQSPQERFAYVSKSFGTDENHAQRLYEYSSKHWLSYSTPILSFGRSKRGLPISCFLPYLDDSAEGLVDTLSEVNWLSMLGGGVGIGMGIRSADDKSVGIMPHLRTYDASSLAYRQGRTRRGSYAAYLDVSHPDIISFLEMRKPTGDPNLRTMNLHHGINITDDFMILIEQAMVDKKFDDSWELKDPHSGEVKEVISAKELWQRILEARFRTGSPYLNFIDTANRGLPESQRSLGLTIRGSNLCNEIHLATSEERTAVCCLSSVNLEKWDEWRDTRMVQDLVRLLDNVLKFFIRNAPEEIEKARYSAYMERSIGIGAMGFHGYLQNKGIAWESWQASSQNYQMFKRIKEDALKSTYELGKERGECPDMAGTGRRNAHLLAIAPNANSSIICGCSASIEPIKSNAYTHRTRAGAHLVKNKALEKVLEEHGENTKATWKGIIISEGSVQHLDFLTGHEKSVFKTAFELDQAWVVEHAAKRQEFICQGQSVNLFFPAGVEPKYPNAVHMKAWKDGLKGLYYLRTNAGVSADKVGKSVARTALKDYASQEEEGDECLSCQG